ncbi:Holliday junction resolvase RecU [Carnobacterium maltaromaticum]|uniref:Holliday junction resolvase RecU n=1 Tax=Carnobacterium maltaromaticum TaxID=2751 RepID=UPI000C76B8D3|nr:Holliday junction resolvase RecU [Carnobacterium maltaromaticum]PLS38090.1 Holliday junction resolvase RecU [Carnobacterium maltaromaticum]PLS38467.1 Holliday junction resolvase RecU [Carnobacterium maltaromaticum]PLS38844.1 Holliday junction resolvase RecU [Carnobacterium maltaromaticum]PLS45114.1 Holliday junction resolvase RecU [Carnobacterium maltaromaticum]PLS47970.1 Holliday junction resolvase RecU [Carnobacterium maltaromaticum]
MAIKYPNGKSYTNSAEFSKKKQAPKKDHSFAKRGMTLEEDINASNESYLAFGKAVIHKKPTPVQIVQVDYPKRSAAVIKEAYFRQASTTDYNGVYKGFYLDFEAKETKNKQSFPLKNFHEHQITHMKQCIEQQAICFVLLRFSLSNRLFLLEATKLISFWDLQNNEGRKSIPLEELEKSGYELYYGLSPRISYLDAVDLIIEKADE